MKIMSSEIIAPHWENQGIVFKRAELSDKKWMEPLLVKANLSGCQHNFTNIFAWSEIYEYQVAQVNDYLAVKGFFQDNPVYFYPAGSGELRLVFESLRQDAALAGHKFVLAGLSPENIAVMQSLFPGQFEYEAMRDGFDYVYLLDKLVALSGNKLHAKRNHINRFKKENQDWSFEEITLANIGECWEMNERWCEINAHNEEAVKEESCAVSRCFNHYAELGLEGGLIRLDGRVVAFTMGEILNADTYVIHIEKAYADIRGAYQMINREFAALVQKKYPHLVYMNREEDMGFAGLRKAKLSYYPDKMEEKYIATFRKA